MKLNLDQIKTLLVGVPAIAAPIVAFLVSNGVPKDIAAIVVVCIVSAGGLVYLVVTRSDASQVLTASQVPGVAPLKVDTGPNSLAPASVQALAHDDSPEAKNVRPST